MLDVLNENGIKTGEIASRKDVHKLGLWHRACICIIVNDDNEILMQKRAENKEKYPGLWDISVASHVASKDNSLKTVMRETNEEIGVQIGYRAEVRDFRFLTSFRSQLRIGDFIENQFYDLFVLRRNLDPATLSFTDEEVSEVRYLKYADILKLKNSEQLHPRTEWFDEVFDFISSF